MSGHGPTVSPSPWVVRFAPLIPKQGTVLDFACGNGRHVRYLADHGHPVVALDRNGAALAALQDIKAIEIIEADLESGAPWPLGDRRFAGIVVTNYLHRPLFPALLDALAHDGVLIYETFAMGNERYGGPSNPHFLLRPGELLDVVRDQLRVVAFEEGAVQVPRPAVIQRLCAVKSSEAAAPILS